MSDNRPQTWYVRDQYGRITQYGTRDEAKKYAHEVLEEQMREDAFPISIEYLEWGELMPSEVTVIEWTPRGKGSSVGFSARLVKLQPNEERQT